MTVVGESDDGRSTVFLAENLVPDVIIMNSTMPSLNGIEATRQIIALGNNIRIILLASSCALDLATEALRGGASGYLLENSAAMELILAIRAVAQGDTYLSPKVTEAVVGAFVRDRELGVSYGNRDLTPKQREILQLLADGKSNKEVAASLSVTTKIVETHRAQITKKLQINRWRA